MRITDLTPEQRRVLLAEAAGWTDAGLLHGAWMGVHPDGHIDEPFEELPSFDSDLNACADLESKLTDEQRNTYINALYSSVDPMGDLRDEHSDWVLVHASANQRASALLLTLVENLEP